MALVSVAPGAAGRPALTSPNIVRQTPVPALQAAVAAVRGELRGIPQQGLVLGASSAPVAVFEYADLVCAPCATAARTTVASLIRRFVRSRAVSIELEPIVESPRSEQFALGVFAAGEQSQGWDYAQLAYTRSTSQSDGPLDSPGTLAASLGLNRRLWRSACRRPLWPALIEQAARVALVGGFTAYPVFIVRSTVSTFSPPFVKVLSAPTTAQLSATIRRALRGTG
jgi:protein-disulfide isomerase